MKKLIIASAFLIGTAGVITTTVQSCTTLATTDLGVSIIRNLLLTGIDKGLGTLNNKEAFLQSNLIDKALPSQLRDINSMLEKIAPSLVAKEKDYIAQAAAYTVNVSRPILTTAVNSLNASDVARVISGPKGTATQILKEKTSQQLVAAIAPKVDEQLNQFGIVKTMNTALAGTNLLGSLFGNKSNSLTAGTLSNLASEQIVNGLFNIVEDYEKQNSANILGGLVK